MGLIAHRPSSGNPLTLSSVLNATFFRVLPAFLQCAVPLARLFRVVGDTIDSI
jgi:hypothetical protein